MLKLSLLFRWTAAASLFFSMVGAASAQSGPVVGDVAPVVEGTTADGAAWSSRSVAPGKLLVIYFYPAAMTGGCTAQACAFRDRRTKLTELGADVIAVSGDRKENLQVFRKANRLNFPLLADPEGKIAESFGVPVQKGGSISREVDGETVVLTRDHTLARWTFIVGPDGKIVYRDTEVDAAGDADAVIAAIESFKAR